jgi:MFS family permease
LRRKSTFWRNRDGTQSARFSWKERLETMTVANADIRADDLVCDSIGPWAVAMTGLVSMALGVSLDRFVFTPLLPMMLSDGSVTLAQGGALATSNYVGYLLGALLCLCIRPDPARMLRAALVLTVVLTLAMALPGSVLLWGTWRALAGICCAFVMVYGTAWSQLRLGELGRPKLAGLMFCGPGIGIVLTSVPTLGMVTAHWPASWAWLAFTLLGMAMLASIWRFLRPASYLMLSAERPAPSVSTQHVFQKLDLETWAVTIIFGLAGFGYIITATFLPVIASHAMPGSPWINLFWPMFGGGVTVGAWLVTRVGMHHDNRRMLMILYIVQAIGVGVAAVWPTVIGFVLCSLLVGTPFLAITSFAMREARRLWGANATKLIGLMTASYATGQIAGPILATGLVARTNGFGASLGIAAAALLIGALGCLVLILTMPMCDHAARP